MKEYKVSYKCTVDYFITAETAEKAKEKADFYFDNADNESPISADGEPTVSLYI